MDYNARQCNHCSRKDIDDFDFVVNTNHKKKLDYKDKLEQDHTYTGMKGDYLQKREKWDEENDEIIVIFANIFRRLEQSLDDTLEDSLGDNIVITDQDGNSYNYENEEFCAEEEEEDEDHHGEDVDEEDVSFW